MNENTQTDAERVMELRLAADEAQAARLEVIGEVALLTTALRQAEAERDAAQSEAEQLAELVSEAMCITEALRVIGHNCQTSNGNLYQFGNKCRAALAAHAAATGKQG